MTKKTDSFDQAYQKLQQIYHRIQDEQVSIDELSALTQEAKVLIDFCKEALRNVEANIQTYLKE